MFDIQRILLYLKIIFQKKNCTYLAIQVRLLRKKVRGWAENVDADILGGRSRNLKRS